MEGEYDQNVSCRAMQTRMSKALGSKLRVDISKCINCQQTKGKRAPRHDLQKQCIFKGFRRFIRDNQSGEVSVTFRDDGTSKHMSLRAYYHPEHVSSDVSLKKSIAAIHLLPIVRKEIRAYADGPVIFRPMEVSARILCDLCESTLFSESWFCTSCGQEYCVECLTNLTLCHSRTMMLRLTRFRLQDLKRLEKSIEETAQLEAADLVTPISSTRRARTFKKHQLTDEKFTDYWRHRRPIVVTGLDKGLQCPWTPEFLIQEYGETQCEVQDCESGEHKACTVAHYFSLFEHCGESPGSILKLKDWPPKDSFKVMFPQLFEDFENVLPLPEYTTALGPKNLAAHFPLNSVAPDLGPKMYNALSSIFDDSHSGSTRLHLDMSDAVNLLTYASTTRDGSAGYALWHIFAPEDSDRIHQYLRGRDGAPRPGDGDPIHNQDTYLTPTMLNQLEERYSVRPYIIRQYPGHAVFIPAGCAHQVVNLAHCIKVASDFISPQSVSNCRLLEREFRIQRMARQWPPDVIPISLMLYYTWASLDVICKIPSFHGSPTPLTNMKVPVSLGRDRASDSLPNKIKAYYCPLCLSSRRSMHASYGAVASFQYSSGLLHHVTQFHHLDVSNKEKNRWRGLDAGPLAKRVLKLSSAKTVAQAP